MSTSALALYSWAHVEDCLINQQTVIKRWPTLLLKLKVAKFIFSYFNFSRSEHYWAGRALT